jgi:hypothetical protein
MCSVISFGGVHLPGDESNGLRSMALVLGEYSAESEVGSIGGDGERERGVWDAENGGLGHEGLEFLEGLFGTCSPQVGDILVREVGEGGSNSGVVGDKATIVVAHAEEGLEFLEIGGGWPCFDGFYFLGVGGDTLCRDDMAQVLDSGLEKLAFGCFAIELVFAEESKDLTQVFLVVSLVLAVYEDIINVHDDTFVKEGAENVLNQGLECGGSIGKTKWHDLVLKVAVASAERGLLNVIFMDPDLVVARTEIDLGEDLGAMELVGEVINEGDGESVLDGDGIQGTIINAHAEFAALLLDEDHRGTIGGEAGFNGSVAEEFVKFFSQGVKFEGRHAVNGAPRGRTVRFQLNAMVNVSFRGKFSGEFSREDISEVLQNGDHSGVQFICESGLFFGDLASKAEILRIQMVEISQGDQSDGDVWGKLRDRVVLGVVKGDAVGAPVDRGIPFLQPRFTKDDIIMDKGGYSKVDFFVMLVKTQVRGKDSFIAWASRTIGERQGDIYNIMGSKRKTCDSICRDKVSHRTTVHQDADGGVVEGSVQDQGFLAEFDGFANAADIEFDDGSSHRV